MRRRKNESIKFENHIRKSIRRRFPRKKGWEIEQERTLRNRLRADYVLSNTKNTKKRFAIVEAKNVRELTDGHVRQLEEYCKAFRNVKDRLIAVPSGTKISKEVRANLKKAGIKVIHTRFKKRAR